LLSTFRLTLRNDWRARSEISEVVKALLVPRKAVLIIYQVFATFSVENNPRDRAVRPQPVFPTNKILPPSRHVPELTTPDLHDGMPRASGNQTLVVQAYLSRPNEQAQMLQPTSSEKERDGRGSWMVTVPVRPPAPPCETARLEDFDISRV